ncbi:class I SAM-dependent methyltransferase [candidate division KSB1 bacterium]|nr:class I SAM-dependent methyltransferase [candidate division KSB1 bacterium]
MKAAFKTAEKENQRHWDEIAPVHLNSYQSVKILKSGGVPLDEIQLGEVGEVAGKTLLHLQCHIGTDSLSWARKGAIVTGVDFSERSINCANRLKLELSLDAMFIQSNVYDLRQHLDATFDIVYNSQGVLCWLRDLDQWASLIAHFLKPGGFFYLMESHPVCDMFEEDESHALQLTYPYFHLPSPTCWDEPSPDYSDATYISHTPSYEWNWSISDIINALLKAGLALEFFNEYDRLFFKRFPGMVREADGWYYLPKVRGEISVIIHLTRQEKLN